MTGYLKQAIICGRKEMIGEESIWFMICYRFSSSASCLRAFRGSSWNPSNCPTSPVGFGTGHSLPCLGESNSPCSVLLRRTFLFPSSSSSPSAYMARGAGHGRMCGIPTTRKDTSNVVPKSEVVRRERGCRWEGIEDGENGLWAGDSIEALWKDLMIVSHCSYNLAVYLRLAILLYLE